MPNLSLLRPQSRRVDKLAALSQYQWEEVWMTTWLLLSPSFICIAKRTKESQKNIILEAGSHRVPEIHVGSSKEGHSVLPVPILT